MSSRMLDDWVGAYMQYTENSEPPVLFRKWVAVATVAAVLQRKCWLQWDKQTFPNLYIVLVAPSGKARKGTAMGPGYSMLRKIGVKMAAEAITREALIRELAQCNDSITDGKTAKFHCSLTVFSQELTVFLGYNNSQLMADLCDWYDCRDQWTYRTKNVGTDEIFGVWVNLIGATTPELLIATMPKDAVGGGFTSRTIFVYEQNKAKLVALPWLKPKEAALYDALLHDLQAIQMLRGEFKISSGWTERWVDWYHYQAEHPPFSLPNLSGYIERRPTHMLKLCMVLNASRTDSMLLDSCDFDAAIALLTTTEKKMPQTFTGFGRNKDAETMSRVMQTIALNKTVSFGDLMRIYHNDVDKEGLAHIIATLESMRFCRCITDADGSKVQYLEKDNNGDDH